MKEVSDYLFYSLLFLFIQSKSDNKCHEKYCLNKIWYIKKYQKTMNYINSKNKKRSLDSRRRNATTQTQNKTRQNYYAFLYLLCFLVKHKRLLQLFTYPQGLQV